MHSQACLCACVCVCLLLCDFAHVCGVTIVCVVVQCAVRVAIRPLRCCRRCVCSVLVAARGPSLLVSLQLRASLAKSSLHRHLRWTALLHAPARCVVAARARPRFGTCSTRCCASPHVPASAAVAARFSLHAPGMCAHREWNVHVLCVFVCMFYMFRVCVCVCLLVCVRGALFVQRASLTESPSRRPSGWRALLHAPVRSALALSAAACVHAPRADYACVCMCTVGLCRLVCSVHEVRLADPPRGGWALYGGRAVVAGWPERVRAASFGQR